MCTSCCPDTVQKKFKEARKQKRERKERREAGRVV